MALCKQCLQFTFLLSDLESPVCLLPDCRWWGGWANSYSENELTHPQQDPAIELLFLLWHRRLTSSTSGRPQTSSYGHLCNNVSVTRLARSRHTAGTVANSVQCSTRMLSLGSIARWVMCKHINFMIAKHGVPWQPRRMHACYVRRCTGSYNCQAVTYDIRWPAPTDVYISLIPRKQCRFSFGLVGCWV